MYGGGASERNSCMKLPTREEWTNEKFVETVMKAKGWERERAAAFLEEKYRYMEE